MVRIGRTALTLRASLKKFPDKEITKLLIEVASNYQKLITKPVNDGEGYSNAARAMSIVDYEEKVYAIVKEWCLRFEAKRR